MGNEIMQAGAGFDIAPQDAEQAWAVCERLSKSDLVPKDYQGKPANIMVAAQMGAELGLKPLQAIQNIAVINGRPAVWGDALLAIVRGHPECENVEEYIHGEGDQMEAVCRVTRRGQTPVQATFSVADAKKASLWTKQGPWSQYPKRMLQLRARAFALRDGFADALRGIQVAEEVRDVTPPAQQERRQADEEQRSSAADALLRRHGARAGAQQEAEDAEMAETDLEAETDAFLQEIADAETPQAIAGISKRIASAGLHQQALDTLRKAVTDRKAELKRRREEAQQQAPGQTEEDAAPADDPDAREEKTINLCERLEEAKGHTEVYAIIHEATEVLGDGTPHWLRVEAAASGALERLEA